MRIAFGRVAALTVVALSLLSCGGGDGKTGTPTQESRPDPRALADSAAERLAQVKTFHFVLDHENGGLPIALGLTMTRAEGDMQMPDRLRADVQGNASQFGNIRVETEVVSIGSQAQIRNPFDRTKWVPLPGNNPLAQLFDPAQGTAAVLKSVQNPAIVGEEEINRVPVWILQGTVDAGQLEAFTPIAQAGYTVKGSAWIGKSDHLVYRVRLEGPLGPDDVKTVARRVELSRFDVPVTIEQQ